MRPEGLQRPLGLTLPLLLFVGTVCPGGCWCDESLGPVVLMDELLDCIGNRHLQYSCDSKSGLYKTFLKRMPAVHEGDFELPANRAYLFFGISYNREIAYHALYPEFCGGLQPARHEVEVFQLTRNRTVYFVLNYAPFQNGHFAVPRLTLFLKTHAIDVAFVTEPHPPCFFPYLGVFADRKDLDDRTKYQYHCINGKGKAKKARTIPEEWLPRGMGEKERQRLGFVPGDPVKFLPIIKEHVKHLVQVIPWPHESNYGRQGSDPVIHTGAMVSETGGKCSVPDCDPKGKEEHLCIVGQPTLMYLEHVLQAKRLLA